MKKLKKFFLGCTLLLPLLAFLTFLRIVPSLGRVSHPIHFGEAVFVAMTFLALGIASWGLWIIMGTWDEFISWFLWRRQWDNHAYGPYPFPETNEEREALKTWAEGQLEKYAKGCHSRSCEAKEKRAAFLASTTGSILKPSHLLNERDKIADYRKEFEKAQKNSTYWFNYYYRLWDLFKRLGMLPVGAKDPGEFYRAIEKSETV